MKPVSLPGLPSSMRLIRPQNCGNCKYHSAVKGQPQLECRYDPPKATVFMVQPPGPNRPPGFMTHTGFPPVRDEVTCGKWSPMIEGIN